MPNAFSCRYPSVGSANPEAAAAAAAAGKRLRALLGSNGGGGGRALGAAALTALAAVPRTLRDGGLAADAASIRERYLGQARSKVVAAEVGAWGSKRVRGCGWG